MINVGIIGGSGYTGAELIYILTGHKKVNINFATSNKYVGKQISDLYPDIDSNLTLQKYSEEIIEKADFLFVALPHTKAMDVVPLIVKKGKKVVDLSADYRLSEKDYKKFYKVEHNSVDLLKKAIYGLPEIYGEDIKKTQLVANPGYYPTAIILSLAPLLNEGLINNISVSAISGITGAGKNPDKTTHYNFINESIWAYKVAGAHQHLGEINGQLSKISNSNQNITFTPQIGPFARGIYSVTTANIKEEVDLEKKYNDFYKDAPFATVLNEPPMLLEVVETNNCAIFPAIDKNTKKLIVISAIDNLVKGASGQAVQNMNLMQGYDENEGLKEEKK